MIDENSVPQEITQDDKEQDLSSPSASEGIPRSIRSIRDLIDQVTGRNLVDFNSEGDVGLAEHWPYPFLALVAQQDMKLGLLLNLINPAIGGVLLVGPRVPEKQPRCAA